MRAELGLGGGGVEDFGELVSSGWALGEGCWHRQPVRDLEAGATEALGVGGV